MNRLPGIQATAHRLLTGNADLLYTLTGTWSDGTLCRFSVRDPNKGGRSSETQLQTDPIPASLRLLRVHPDDARATPGASLIYQGERLVLGLWADQSIWTGQQVGVCRLVDERAYPLVAMIGVQGFRLRIKALDAPPVQATGLTGTPNNSGLAYTPPGVTLQPGDTFTTDAGDRYQVVPPVQRDALGDTVGVSWQGQGAERPPLPTPDNPDPTPDTPDSGSPGRDPWWDEGLP
ncbi:hypothetical protein DESA109040_05910 [Deinococcus saxicola]|uniref:hypothetical protein n=1 Tax=Deinococcus saxicola TaxID=249406 RepID=UPI0039EF901E